MPILHSILDIVERKVWGQSQASIVLIRRTSSGGVKAINRALHYVGVWPAWSCQQTETYELEVCYQINGHTKIKDAVM